ncbi:fumarylacetoacetate hydrolase family protein [Uliginosibacterium sp. H1]|uniref:fumarylacetoacetate hydrolase family protein n=1 Tax=Uliginosibacterium sp. H1 TaxID=3114757 RepID=UPI002E19D692|nr:fumarylacetoacetate hydrolase family protein [Uliginosibacterium sp. H1]
MSSTEYVIAPPAVVSLPVAGGGRFPVRRIFCVGRNYLEHIRELGNDEREPPVFFMKPTDSIVQDGGIVPYPPGTQNLHFELELVMALKSGGYGIAPDQALAHVFGYAIGLDMTKRDVQKALAGKNQPWELGKAFEHATPCGPVHPVAQTGHIESGRIHLTVNGETKQDSDISQLIWKLPEIIANLSLHYRLQAGDLIFTGTPHGVGPVVAGDAMVGEIAGLGRLSATVGEAEAA